MWKKYPSVSIPGTPYTMKGISVACFNTCLYFPELNIMVDAGASSDFLVDHLMITHCHGDHVFDLHRTLIQAEKKQPTVYVPFPSLEGITSFVKSAMMMTKGQQDPKIMKSIKFRPVTLGTRIPIKLKGQNWIIQPIKCCHSVASTGYGMIELRNKLKPEYAECSNESIVELKKSGISVSEMIEVPLFCVMGDTTHAVFADPSVFSYRTIIVECTFLADKDMKHAKKDKHMHWKHLKPIILAHPANHFILIHFSARYSPDEIDEHFKKENIPNITPFIFRGTVHTGSESKCSDDHSDDGCDSSDESEHAEESPQKMIAVDPLMTEDISTNESKED
jgi:ribonuclease Z